MFKTDATGFALFSIRASLFIFMMMWAVLKIITPASYGVSDGGGGIFGAFYGISLGSSAVYVIGGVQVLFLIAFLVGAAKLITTGGVLLMNTTTLFVSLPSIATALGGDGNLLFAASLPVFGASLALFLLRKQDNFLSLGG